MDEKITLEFEDYDIDRILDLADIHSGEKWDRKKMSDKTKSSIATTELLFLVRMARQELGLDMREEDKL